MRCLGKPVQALVEWLSQHPAVHWIEPAAAGKLHNWQGTAVVQSATAAPTAPVLLTQDQGTHPIWTAGLTGAGQIIGAGDSGLGKSSFCSVDSIPIWTS